VKEVTLQFKFAVYQDASELDPEMNNLVKCADEVIESAYAPYSKFMVGSAILMENNEIVKGSNQENASYPVGICAERVALSAALSLYPNVAPLALAISYKTQSNQNSDPIAPCGLCRQFILESEERFGMPIIILLKGENGVVYQVNSVKDLLPLAFTRADLNGR